MRVRSLSLVAAIAACACAESTPPPAGVTNSPPPPPATSAATTESSSPAASAEPPVPSRPLDLTNDCPKDIRLYYGEQPGDGHGDRASVAPGATIPVPRKDDGSVTVWVVDDKGFGLASVHVTRRMRHVRIDASCARIDAGSTR